MSKKGQEIGGLEVDYWKSVEFGKIKWWYHQSYFGEADYPITTVAQSAPK